MVKGEIFQKSFEIESNLALDCDVGDVRGIVVIQPVDVFHNFGFVSFDGSEN